MTEKELRRMEDELVNTKRFADERKKQIFLAAAIICVIFVIVIGVWMVRSKTDNLDIKTGVTRIQELEKEDTAEIESQIEEIETQELHATEAWKNRSLSEKFNSAVILGDSITTGFTAYEILDSSKVVAEIGIHLYELDDLIGTVVNLKPQVLFLALGANDVSATEGDTEAFAESYKKVIDVLQEKLPDTEIYVNSILPVTEKRIQKEPVLASIPDYNVALQKMCEEEGLTYIDNTSIVKEEYYEPDGEHMKKAYYPVWGEHMAEVAEL